ncbi:hypothetical protein BDQ12DRAFT_609472 [Crucibulum laeve]|uniref:DUF3295 domain-containing protein n=1 Tax=Crucibulum laeve TaxID=68775 RepID=A0A5C3M6L0_9AGAR|nr:hypothetical protein BDQ12DRAFT_609472 [Crucibulum laeve]
MQANGQGSGGYRPKGRPQDLELEDDSDSEGEGGGIMVSKSAAEEKLKALAERRTASRQTSAGSGGERRRNIIAPPPVVNPHPAPIPLGHPYNLPPPAAPSTPRTTRRQMLQTELSESLRRNLLWERQVSKQNLVGFKRTASTGGGRGNLLGGLRPLTAAPSMVQLTAKTNGRRRSGGGGGGGEGVEDRDRDKKAAMARNRSWADDFHFKGW